MASVSFRSASNGGCFSVLIGLIVVLSVCFKEGAGDCIVQSSGQAGPDISSSHTSSQEICFSICRNNPSCLAATFDTTKFTNCYPHNLRSTSRQYWGQSTNLYVKDCTAPLPIDIGYCQPCRNIVHDELRFKRQTIANDEQCICNDRGNRDRMYLVEEDAGGAITDAINADLRREARDQIIAQFNNNDLPLQPGTIMRTRNLRLDMQGLVVDDTGARFANLQIQINIRRDNRQSTTIANALVQLDRIVRSSPQVLQPSDRSRITFPVRYIRRVLLHSLTNRDRVWLIQYRSTYNQ